MAPSIMPSQIVKTPSRMIFRGKRRRKSLQHAKTMSNTMDIENAIHIISPCSLEKLATLGTNTKRAINAIVIVS